ncbi:3-hydroxyacyl-CoA dehydrogenase/enoyl-CoA hydratase family protein [Ferroplasma acidiphilum]|jgi:enoyl-CoA hydratase/3-hydroxyacyl-CoA dehydrogenase|uniref:3-hydroxyacyl-CoA dehydrogenase/enoyl-CoA hydratase family protein n=1 Tax=Ferroplasma acidiphilum TaxID=74969 RepID=UPI0023F50B95|nr:3-hydroxyacyl-CoA dehydrogenase NAD-binding domain-containing protein [Ferroplasma acidiphilum]WMT53337.1 MAG: 3-hydroxyacyl-CoA dehydrogenase NAD-binding domain-containing protein [Ferroplasma acidiphilum]
MIKQVAVIGAGVMGHSIAEVFALNGYKVNLEDFYPEVIEKAKVGINGSLDKLIASGKINDAAKKAALDNIKFFNNIGEAVKNVDLSIEVVPEIYNIKVKVLKEIAENTDKIIASNTSNIRITEMGEEIKNPERLVGMHFFNPPILMKLVEVIKGDKTSMEYVEEIYELAGKIGKKPIKVLKDEAGFVVNRISAPEMLLLCNAYGNKIDRPEAIDKYFKSQGLPMGPYQLFDYVGLDTVVDSLQYYGKELSPDYGKCHAFDSFIEAKHLGLKTGSGIYKWENGKAIIPDANESEKISLMDMFALEINEATKLIEDGVAVPDDIETGVKYGLNRPFGPITVANGLSNDEVLETLNNLYKQYKIEVFKPSKTIESHKMKESFNKKPVEVKKEEKSGILDYSKDGKVGVITIKNGKNNLMSFELLKALDKQLDAIEEANDVNVVVIKGNERAFSAGADLSQFISNPYMFMKISNTGESIFDRITRMNKIFIAQLRGYVLGGGFELSLACDIRTSLPDSVIGFPETSLGLIPGYGGSQRLPNLIGISRAMDMILTCERISGEKAYEYGIITRLFKEELEENTMKLAKDLSEKISPASVYVAKRLIYNTATINLDEEALSMGMLYAGNDMKEGVKAFLEKRKPDYKGN